jgi:methylmalonyl-CoA/ethylmalonyl-CoA epimerase
VTPAGFHVDQVGIVVRDLDGALARHDEVIGGGPWRIWTYGPEIVPRQMLRGAESSFTMRIALSSSVPQIELIEPVSGPSIYEEWLDIHGEGLHHLGMFEPDLDAAIARMAGRGFPVLQSGRGYGLDGDGGFVYFDTVRDLGVILELIQVPRRRRDPEGTWPSKGIPEAAA